MVWGARLRVLSPFDKRVDHALLARLVESDEELVAFDRDDVAVAEFLVEHALADAVRRGRTGRARHQFAVDRHRAAPPRCALAVASRLVEPALLGAVRLGALPSRRLIVRAEGFHCIEPRGHAAPAEA